MGTAIWSNSSALNACIITQLLGWFNGVLSQRRTGHGGHPQARATWVSLDLPALL
jgi:hypothetical protein